MPKLEDLVALEENRKVDSPCPEKKVDPRLASKRFSGAVRKVLTHLGEEPNRGNFRKWEGLVDWYAFARNIDHPTRHVLYHTLDPSGRIVEIMGRPVVGCQEIVACTDSEAAEILAKDPRA